MTTIQSTTARQAAASVVSDDVHDGSHYGREITDESAVAIAAWWQSPGAVGHVLASLASGRPVDLDDLLTDIHHTRKGASTAFDRLSLDMLATWAINHPSRDDRS